MTRGTQACRVLLRIALVAAVVAFAGCTKRPPRRFPERDALCGPGQQAYHVVGPGQGADERNFPDCSVLHWDDTAGGGVAICCPRQ